MEKISLAPAKGGGRCTAPAIRSVQGWQGAGRLWTEISSAPAKGGGQRAVQGAGDQERDGPELAGARAGRRPSWLAPALIASWPPPALIASWPASALIADQIGIGS
jgi:hypothetical protein